MKYYIIMKNPDNTMLSINKYDTEKHPMDETKKAIKEWDKDTIPELIEDERTIKILDFIHRFDDDIDLQKKYDSLQKKHDNLNNAVSEIQGIIHRLTY